ncbi:single-stranded DNA-binding protein [Leucobacter insecticola]|uniref:Single-stranded DNA-binding protein n=1 Tax=Leucobacter insecticola TaxID=2714934 RepID=A0A6G8FIX1_9MICO|nr:single-stranded DNA-binding protein [Leucobacter insecticola]QIM16400.1 single-stranded DNA-binding protein [Leucobacter insecticola]
MTIQISAVGTIATSPRLLNAENRAAFCTFRVACNDRRYDREKGRWVDGDTNWLTINAFRTLAEHAHESFAKGDRIVLSGRLRMRDWDNGSKSGTSVEVDADALGHDLRWGVSSFTKRSVPSSAPEQNPESVPPGEDAQPSTPHHGAEQSGASSFIPAEESSAPQGWLMPTPEAEAAA